MWNNLPHVIQAEGDLNEFKKQLDAYHSIVGSFQFFFDFADRVMMVSSANNILCLTNLNKLIY